MNKISVIKDFAETVFPKLKKVGGYAAAVAATGKRKIGKTKAKLKWHLKLAKLKQIIEVTMNIVLLIASVIALVIAFLQIICKKDK